MSETLASLRRKIDGADKLKSVVRTMKAMAASSIGQYQAAVLALASYETAVNQGLGVCFRQTVPMLSAPSSPPSAETGVVVFGTDQGLVGSFNEVLSTFVVEALAALPGPKKVWAVGHRVKDHLLAAGLPLEGTFTVPTSVGAITALVAEIQWASETHGGRDGSAQLYVFHNHTEAGDGRQYQPESQRLLPLDAAWQRGLAAFPWPGKSLPELITGKEQTMRALVREYLFISVYKACAQSLASENAARLAAMQRAEKNIEGLYADLAQSFNRLRQSSIDEELFDVVAGFKALN